MLKEKIWLITSALVLVPLLLWQTGCHVSRAEREDIQLKLRTLNRESWSLTEQRGKYVVLSFSSVRFPLVGKTLPALEKLAQRYAGRNVNVYWVSTDSATPGVKGYVADAELRNFAERHTTHVTVLRDPNKAEFQRLRLDAIPTLVIVGHNGELLRTYVGFDAESGRGYRDVQDVLDAQFW